nr:hypothetical protein [Tanacetum cinerariifolium]
MVQFKLQPVGKTFVCGDHGPVTLPKHMAYQQVFLGCKHGRQPKLEQCSSMMLLLSFLDLNAPLKSMPATPTLAATLDLATPTPPTPSLPWVTSSMYTQTKHFAIELYGHTIRRHH